MTLARLAGCGLACLLLAACASMMPPEMTAAPADQGAVDASGTLTPAVKPPPPAYPTFGAPKQIGDRPVMNPADQTKMQSDLETLAKQREGELLKDIEQSQ